jgi:hypothetical protein
LRVDYFADKFTLAFKLPPLIALSFIMGTNDEDKYEPERFIIDRSYVDKQTFSKPTLPIRDTRIHSWFDDYTR